MNEWNLRRVRVGRSPCADECNCPPPRFTHVYEVFYNEQGRPWTYDDAHFLDKIRLIRDWLRTPVLRFPEDFTGEPEWMKNFSAAMKSGEWKNWEQLF
jgi:hypothetical protein